MGERIQIEPSFPACSRAGENCANTGCCQVSGHKCFTKGQGRAQCNETCTAGKMGFTCDIVAPHSVPVANPLGQNLYCFSVYTENTGNVTAPNHELELLNLAAARTAGIFACEQWDVFSDVSVTIKVEDTNNEFHQLKRKDSGTWVNWAIFYQVWLKVREVAKWQAADYTIKVDADAVFAPQRLRTWLSTKPGDSPHGLYYEYCRSIWRIAMRSSARAPTTAAIGSSAHGARTCLPRGAWTTTMWTRLRPSMLPQTPHAKPTGPRARRQIPIGIQQIALRSRRLLHTPLRSPQSTRSA